MKQKDGIIYHNGYYRLSKRLRYVRYGVLVLLLLFTVILFAAFRQDMTLNHFRYLLRNFDFSPNAEETSGDTIYYDGDSTSTFGFVSGGLAVLTDTRVFVTDRSSATTFSDYHGFREPKGVYGDTYMLIYDRLGSTVKVYNAFSLLKTLTFSGTVRGAAIDERGNFAVAVSDVDGYYSKIYLYNDKFQKVREISKYKYVTSLSLCDGRLLLCSLFTDAASGKTANEILCLDSDKTEPRFTLTLFETVYEISLTKDTASLLTSDGRYDYDLDGKRQKTLSFDGMERMMLLTKGVLLCGSSNDTRQETWYYLDKEGRVSVTVSDRLVSAKEDADFLYLLFENSLWLYDKDERRFEALSSALSLDGALTLVCDGKRVYLASAVKALRLDGEALLSDVEKKTD